MIDEAAVVSQVFAEIPPGSGENLAEVIGRDFANVRSDLITDLEDLSEDIDETLTAIEAEQGSDHAVVAGFLCEDFDGNRDGAWVGWIEVVNLAEARCGFVERANGIGGGPIAFANVQQVVGGDAIEPGTELGFATEAGKGSDGFEEDVLGCVFGIGAAVEHADRQVVDPWGVAGEEETKLFAVSCVGIGE